MNSPELEIVGSGAYFQGNDGQTGTGFKVTCDPAFGMGCEFSCGSIEVLNAIPWNVSKRPPRWLLKEGLSKIK